jgi:hypothetical protein
LARTTVAGRLEVDGGEVAAGLAEVDPAARPAEVRGGMLRAALRPPRR